jgi:hypothetical protein
MDAAQAMVVLQRLLGPIFSLFLLRRRRTARGSAPPLSHDGVAKMTLAALKKSSVFGLFPSKLQEELSQLATLRLASRGETVLLTHDESRHGGLMVLLEGAVTVVEAHGTQTRASPRRTSDTSQPQATSPAVRSPPVVLNEEEMIGSSPCSSTIRSSGLSQIGYISSNDFEMFLGRRSSDLHGGKSPFLARRAAKFNDFFFPTDVLFEQSWLISLLKTLDANEADDSRDAKIKFTEKLSRHAQAKSYLPDTVIVSKGEPIEHVYLIQRGRVRVTPSSPHPIPGPSTIFGEGSTFGEISVVFGDVSRHSVTAVGICDVWLIPGWVLLQTLEERNVLSRGSFATQVNARRIKWLSDRRRAESEAGDSSANPLRSVPMLSQCSDRVLTELVAIARMRSFYAGSVIAKEGQPCDALLLVQTGTAIAQLGTTTESYPFFGENCLIPHKWPYSVVASEDGPVDCWWFPLESLRDVLRRVQADRQAVEVCHQGLSLFRLSHPSSHVELMEEAPVMPFAPPSRGRRGRSSIATGLVEGATDGWSYWQRQLSAWRTKQDVASECRMPPSPSELHVVTDVADAIRNFSAVSGLIVPEGSVAWVNDPNFSAIQSERKALAFLLSLRSELLPRRLRWIASKGAKKFDKLFSPVFLRTPKNMSGKQHTTFEHRNSNSSAGGDTPLFMDGMEIDTMDDVQESQAATRLQGVDTMEPTPTPPTGPPPNRSGRAQTHHGTTVSPRSDRAHTASHFVSRDGARGGGDRPQTTGSIISTTHVRVVPIIAVEDASIMLDVPKLAVLEASRRQNDVLTYNERNSMFPSSHHRPFSARSDNGMDRMVQFATAGNNLVSTVIKSDASFDNTLWASASEGEQSTTQMSMEVLDDTFTVDQTAASSSHPPGRRLPPIMLLLHVVRCDNLAATDTLVEPIVKVSSSSKVYLRTPHFRDLTNPSWTINEASFMQLLMQRVDLNLEVVDGIDEKVCLYRAVLQTSSIQPNRGFQSICLKLIPLANQTQLRTATVTVRLSATADSKGNRDLLEASQRRVAPSRSREISKARGGDSGVIFHVRAAEGYAGTNLFVTVTSNDAPENAPPVLRTAVCRMSRIVYWPVVSAACRVESEGGFLTFRLHDEDKRDAVIALAVVAVDDLTLNGIGLREIHLHTPGERGVSGLLRLNTLWTHTDQARASRPPEMLAALVFVSRLTIEETNLLMTPDPFVEIRRTTADSADSDPFDTSDDVVLRTPLSFGASTASWAPLEASALLTMPPRSDLFDISLFDNDHSQLMGSGSSHLGGWSTHRSIAVAMTSGPQSEVRGNVWLEVLSLPVCRPPTGSKAHVLGGTFSAHNPVNVLALWIQGCTGLPLYGATGLATEPIVTVRFSAEKHQLLKTPNRAGANPQWPFGEATMLIDIDAVCTGKTPLAIMAADGAAELTIEVWDTDDFASNIIGFCTVTATRLLSEQSVTLDLQYRDDLTQPPTMTSTPESSDGMYSARPPSGRRSRPSFSSRLNPGSITLQGLCYRLGAQCGPTEAAQRVLEVLSLTKTGLQIDEGDENSDRDTDLGDDVDPEDMIGGRSRSVSRPSSAISRPTSAVSRPSSARRTAAQQPVPVQLHICGCNNLNTKGGSFFVIVLRDDDILFATPLLPGTDAHPSWSANEASVVLLHRRNQERSEIVIQVMRQQKGTVSEVGRVAFPFAAALTFPHVSGDGEDEGSFSLTSPRTLTSPKAHKFWWDEGLAFTANHTLTTPQLLETASDDESGDAANMLVKTFDLRGEQSPDGYPVVNVALFVGKELAQTMT